MLHGFPMAGCVISPHIPFVQHDDVDTGEMKKDLSFSLDPVTVSNI